MPSTAPKGSSDNAPTAAEQQYALVSRGAVVGLRGPTAVRPNDGDFSDEYPADSKWLPIVDIEKQTFDARTHVAAGASLRSEWRFCVPDLHPSLTVRANTAVGCHERISRCQRELSPRQFRLDCHSRILQLGRDGSALYQSRLPV